jgi:uncharacterized protein (UPF0276 family)
LDFFEIHAENFMGAGGPPLRWLTVIRDRFQITMHGVCLSVGGRDPLDTDHLDRLAALVDRFEPAIVSEHLAWSSDSGLFLDDLLPPPLTEETLLRTAEHVDQIQTRLNRRVLIENPSSYLEWSCNHIAEPVFLNELARRTGCGILLDVNNVFVSASNLGFSQDAYIDDIDAAAVEQIHLAGHAIDTYSNVTLRVDNHGDHVCDEVWSLFERFVRQAGPRPTLIEWDTNTPALERLAEESAKASQRLMGATA